MKEHRLGPRQWAFVVVAGGAVIALPFMQRQPDPKPDPPVVDVATTLLPEAELGAPAVAFTTAGHVSSDPASGVAAPSATVWPGLPHSPFDELVQQKAVVPDAQPAEEIVPMRPLRPWISAPGLNSSDRSAVAAKSEESFTPLGSMPLKPKVIDAVVSASPFREEADAVDDVGSVGVRSDDVGSRVVSSYGHGRRGLPVNAGPADQYTQAEIAQKLNLPKQDLVSAVVPADQVLPIPVLDAPQTVSLAGQSLPANLSRPEMAIPTDQAIMPNGQAARTINQSPIPKSSVVLSRQPTSKPVGAQVRFGQANTLTPDAAAQSSATYPAMTPLPQLPEERRGHIIMQPRRP